MKRHIDSEDKRVGEIPNPYGFQKMIIVNEKVFILFALKQKSIYYIHY
ncbi:hypothetical protein LA791_015840 [Clostridioides difficile]|nr:hypothetical protein [Clostridioides difficile]MCR1707659.1 hypothetical protein [Clostridioides difficile]